MEDSRGIFIYVNKKNKIYQNKRLIGQQICLD